ncbi:right-handed parallel beta-helix repeat-containing protein [Paenibacillus thalictri]|uniref:right-handed parallel beta-helix repeat-containing protein n=1 Tax=Paenibacillus thalictri TaxID=2527873 RepID=UPI0013EF135C|nr:NosD domain-containing protein [Paenibacillus thalictri]
MNLWRSAVIIVIAAATALFAEPWDIRADAGEAGHGRSLQQLIDGTPAGGTLVLPEGEYEGTAAIRKPLTIRGTSDVRISGGGSDKPVIAIEASGVRLENLQISQMSKAETAAVLITAERTVIDSLRIDTRSFGIMLRDSGHNEIVNSVIRWQASPAKANQAKLSDKRNGIDLFNSHDNRIYGNSISTMNDGIYLENSHRNTVENNRIDHSRYGVHCMYTDGTIVRGNIGSFNVTGAMVMGVKDAIVSGNTFTKQSENVNSQGLLLFDVQTSLIEDNKVEGNRVGFYIEQSQRNEIRHNEVLQNFVGIQLLESEGNRFQENRFTGNVIESEASESSANLFISNIWDSFQGIDTDGDGVSNTAYAMNPFFQKLTSATPAYQLFFHSPGMLFLESMFTAGKEEWTVDKTPLMRSGDKPSAARTQETLTMLCAALLLTVSSITTIIYLGVRRK